MDNAPINSKPVVPAHVAPKPESKAVHAKADGPPRSLETASTLRAMRLAKAGRASLERIQQLLVEHVVKDVAGIVVGFAEEDPDPGLESLQQARAKLENLKAVKAEGVGNREAFEQVLVQCDQHLGRCESGRHASLNELRNDAAELGAKIDLLNLPYSRSDHRRAFFDQFQSNLTDYYNAQCEYLAPDQDARNAEREALWKLYD